MILSLGLIEGSALSGAAVGCGSARARRFTVKQFGGEQHAQFAQLVNGQGDVAVFASQVFGQVEQQGADAGEGFVAVGDEGFGAGVGDDGEEGG